MHLYSFNKFLKLFNEWLGLPLAIALYFIGPSLIRMIDPQAGSYDAGQLNILFFGVIKVLIASSVAWIGYRLNFPKLYSYFLSSMEQDFIAVSESSTSNQVIQCVKLSLFVYFCYMALVIWCLQTV